MRASERDGSGSFVRVRTLGFAVEYAGIRVRESTTADETITLVASKLRLDGAERQRRKIVMVYPLVSERARRGRAKWRVRTLRGGEALLPLRRKALSGRKLDSRDDVRFYLHDESSTPLDLCEFTGDAASGSESSDDERPPQAKYVGDRSFLESRPHVRIAGTLLKRSDDDANLWRRRRCVIVDDRFWYWRETSAPEDETAKNGDRRRVSPLEYEVDRVARSRCATIPLASNSAKEVTGRRDVPHGIEVSTASRNLYFRAETRSSQLEWLKVFNDAIEQATENEYFSLAELIITDEQQRRPVNADILRELRDIERQLQVGPPDTMPSGPDDDDPDFYFGLDLYDPEGMFAARDAALTALNELSDYQRMERRRPDDDDDTPASS